MDGTQLWNKDLTNTTLLLLWDCYSTEIKAMWLKLTSMVKFTLTQTQYINVYKEQCFVLGKPSTLSDTFQVVTILGLYQLRYRLIHIK